MDSTKSKMIVNQINPHSSCRQIEPAALSDGNEALDVDDAQEYIKVVLLQINDMLEYDKDAKAFLLPWQNRGFCFAKAPRRTARPVV